MQFSSFLLPGKQGSEKYCNAKAFFEVVLEIILVRGEALQHNLGSVYVEKVNIDAELVNLNNAENQTGSFRLLKLILFFPPSTVVGLILFHFGFA